MGVIAAQVGKHRAHRLVYEASIAGLAKADAERGDHRCARPRCTPTSMRSPGHSTRSERRHARSVRRSSARRRGQRGGRRRRCFGVGGRARASWRPGFDGGVADGATRRLPRRRGADHQVRRPRWRWLGTGSEIDDAPILHTAMGYRHLAYVVMLCEQGIVPRRDRQPLTRALLELTAIPASEFPYDCRYGDVYNSQEKWLRIRSAPRPAG